jgi:hypothetical protein
MRFDQPRHHHIRNSAASLPHSDTGHLHLQPRCVTRRRSKFPQLTIHDTIYACFESDEDISIVKKQLFVRLHELTSAIQLLSIIAARRISKSAMDEQSALIRVERTFWNVWVSSAYRN